MLQPITPSIFPGLLPSQEPAASRGSSEGQQPLPVRAAPLTLEAESCFLVLSPFPLGTAMGMVFPAVGRGQLLATGIPQGCGEALQGAGPKVGVVRASPCTAPSLIGTKNAKGQGLLLAPIPFHGPAVTRPEWEPQ